jgi:hypothetical protein
VLTLLSRRPLRGRLGVAEDEVTVETSELEEAALGGREPDPLHLGSARDAVPVDPLHHRHAAQFEERELATVDDERLDGTEIQHLAQEVPVRVGVADVDFADETHLVELG